MRKDRVCQRTFAHWAALGCLGLLLPGVLPADFVSLASAEKGWRNDGTGHFPAGDPPVKWSAEQNIAWKTKLPGASLASPILVDGRLFVLAEPSDLICVAASDGQIQWSRSHRYVDLLGEKEGKKIERDLEQAKLVREKIDAVQREKQEARKAENEPLEIELEAQINALRKEYEALTAFPPLKGGDTGNTGCTPASDGKNVFAAFGTGVVSSHTLDGKQNWMVRLEPSGNDMSASPIAADGKLIVQARQLTALDAATGKVLWTAPQECRHGSPVLAHVNSTAVVVTPTGSVLRLADGEVLAQGLFRLNHCSPLANGETIYAQVEGAVKAIDLAAAIDEKTADNAVLWEASATRADYLASPLLYDGLLYCVNEQGLLEVSDAVSGDRVYRKRLPFAGGRVDPSLSLGGDRLYVSNNRGSTLVIAPGREYLEIAQNELDAEFKSSLAFDDAHVYIRTKDHLVCVGE
ncbi:outer membrane protein assembly factor BamB family protein [Lignipirellula cremea]|uniref:Outer membrane biogenesis protein BamB n=1 Tax=Lignipirellula cremea TaxID=2528010 RepID=A0A518DRH9_9BACT|nr:PQQ-binding-like beta-propeller repeat protein [Lignipirellula cremea]QDU94436.1 outer membrane biogenesis protein BamB [Lignipirellula cremea]